MNLTKKERKMAMNKKEMAKMERMYFTILKQQKHTQNLYDDNVEKDKRIKELRDEIFHLKNKKNQTIEQF